jgi:hypothetical protein
MNKVDQKFKLYISHSSSFDYENELYKPIKNSDLFSEYEIILPHLNSKAQYLTKAGLQEFKGVFAEVSYPSTGQGIELAWFQDADIPIFAVHQSDKSFSGALKFLTNNFNEYTTEFELVNLLDKFILELEKS